MSKHMVRVGRKSSYLTGRTTRIRVSRNEEEDPKMQSSAHTDLNENLSKGFEDNIFQQEAKAVESR